MSSEKTKDLHLEEKHLQPETKEINGILMTKMISDNWDKIWNFQANPDDPLISTYAKAGGYQKMVVEIKPALMDKVKINVELVNEMPSPRITKTHLPFQFMPPSIWEKNCKIIYMARNAKDNMVSYYHFHRMNACLPDPGTWDQYFEASMKGDGEWIPLGIMKLNKKVIFLYGIVGDWKNYFTVAQNETFNEDYRKKMVNTSLTLRTEL
ncbi:sulfotransferase 1C1-like [Trichechus inunguis]